MTSSIILGALAAVSTLGLPEFECANLQADR
jgi:hypothetical protein